MKTVCTVTIEIDPARWREGDDRAPIAMMLRELAEDVQYAAIRDEDHKRDRRDGTAKATLRIVRPQ